MSKPNTPSSAKGRPPILRVWAGDEPIDVDLFAGGGGASEGARRALGRSPTIAVNHSPVAIAMHQANHPDTIHYVEDVYRVNPTLATKGQRVRLLWASPTCTHFSRAKGKALKDNKIRGLAWSILPWIVATRPELIILENVIEFLTWGPIYRDHSPGCAGDRKGQGCKKACHYLTPIKARAGETFRAFERKIRSKGYSFEYRKLTACDYGAPTKRPRVFIIMRADGQPSTWPEPTHAQVPTPTRKRWRAAAEIIDWSVRCPSIFDRAKPHVPATRARLAKGLRKYVLEAEQPFLLPLNAKHRAAEGGAAFAIHRSNGERPGQDPRTYDLQQPCPTIVAEGIKVAPCVTRLAFMAKHYGERRPDEVMAADLREPLSTTTAQDHHALVTVHGWKLGVSYGLLTRYNGKSVGQSPAEPIGVLDTHDRYGIVEVPICSAAIPWTPAMAVKARKVYELMLEHGHDGPWMDHEQQRVFVGKPEDGIVVWDLGMRMLVARELFNANGFTHDYVINPIGPKGKPITKTQQVRAAGNVVCPDVAEAVIRAALLKAPGSMGQTPQM